MLDDEILMNGMMNVTLDRPCGQFWCNITKLICMDGLDRVGQCLGTLEMFACDVLDSRCDRLS